MGLLDKLWDDTVAGPRPDTGLSKLRKYSTFSPRSSSGKELDGGNGRPFGEDFSEEAVKVTRSIMIVKPPGYSSPPVSPAGSTPPVSPFSGQEEAETTIDLGGNHRRRRMKDRLRPDPGALLLLTTCEI
ncbi:dormancy-associated protein homolog 3-like isoform X1 [Aristolochia californica]|uniref:dormancy-associated protein homolog 3-like isoform X1 n=1 Tax=Aristolochia californica TaxID=171875 RepID=UPI0035E093C7